MEISANFAFLTQEFPHVAESAGFAEQHVYGDPRASCFPVIGVLNDTAETATTIRRA